MRRFPLRRTLGALLAFAIIAGAPGSQAYDAAAQTMGRQAGEAGSVRGVPVLGLTGLAAPVPSLSPSALSVSPALLAAPAVAPEIRTMPVKALEPSALRAEGFSAIAAVPMGPARVVAARPSALHAEGLSVMAPSALSLAPSALRAEGFPVISAAAKSGDAGAMFDGSSEKEAASTPVLASRGGRFARALKKGLVIAALSLGLFAGRHEAYAQQEPPPAVQSQQGRTAKEMAEALARKAAAPAQVQAPAVATPQPTATPAHADTVRAVLPRPVEAQASVDRQGVTVGERIHLTITLRNTSDKPVTLQNLRVSIQDALPSDLELQDKDAEPPLTLAPGESKTVTYEAIPFGSGVLTLDGGLAVVSVGEIGVYPEGIEIVMPKTEITVKTVLTPDWKQKGLRDIVGVKRGDGPNWMWLAAIPLGILMLVGVSRLVAARRLYPKLSVERLSLIASTEAELARLKAASAELDAAAFYARYQELLTGFMVDFAGLPKVARDARTLGRDLEKSFYYSGQIDVASRLAAQAEAARFAGSEADASERARMLDRLQALVESVAGKFGKASKPGSTGMLGALALLPGAAGLTFGSPWVLLLLIPFAAYILWSWRTRAKGERFAVSSSAQTPAKRTLRERLAGLPRILRLAAMGLIVVALARPMIGTKRSETFIPSTDTMLSIDLSGSMSGPKLESVREAVKAYVEEQRRGTENRVGMVTFSDNAYLDVKLTTDYDALISHLKELETTNSTAVGKSMLTSIAHFLELNALELDGKADPRAAEVQRLLKDQGLAAALAYAKPFPDLMKTILQPERVKIVVLFTDGESNSGISPLDAADIAASLKVKIYTVGIGENGRGFDSQTLRDVASKTGGKFYAAGDAETMRQVLLEISRLEKSPAKIVSSVNVKDYTSLLALLAFLLLGLEVALANTRLRTLYGLAFVMALNQAPMQLGQLGSSSTMTTAQVSAKSPTVEVPAEVIEGNKLYNQGLYSEALKKYGEAIERHPDVPEIYFNMADAYLRLGENAKADAAWAKYLSLTSDPKKQSQTLFNLGNSAVLAGDGEKAIELYKEALRRDSNNQDAKWNLEVLKQAQKEQQPQQQDSKKGKPGKQKGKGKPGDGKPGDGQPGDGQPGDGKPGDGKPQAKPGDPKEGADKLGEALGNQEKEEKDAARKGLTRKGSGVWGMLALPMAFAGHGIVFSSTIFLWVVGIGLPVAILLVAWGVKKRLEAAKRLSPGTAPKTFQSWWGARRFLGKSALALAALGLIGLTAGDPRGGMTDERVNFGGKDIVVTVDGSHSMIYAEDGRMERTQKELNDFITRLQGTDRVGLVVFAGKARTASPISIDYGNFEFKINRLDVEARGISEGSDLAAAIKYSAAHFETAKKLGDRQRILIIISDGDVPETSIDSAIVSASKHGVTVYAIGVGDPSGTKIKLPTVDGKGTEYLMDSQTGAPAITRLNEGPLRKLAERTGGAYFRADGRTSIDKILEEVSSLEQGQKGDTIKSPRPIGVYLLWPALIMLLLDLVMPGRSLLRRGAPEKKPEAKEKPKGSGGAGMLGVAALIPLGAWPQILPFAALATLVAAYLAADSWSGGAVTRRIREWWQSRREFVQKGVSADLLHLYDLREADERRLSGFVDAWQNAKEPLRETMIEMASHDEALWREKLSAAYLSGAAPETLEKILTALRRTARLRLEPLKPVTDRMSVRRAQISWMAHSDVETRLQALNAAAAGVPVPFVAPNSSSQPYGLLAKLKRRATVAMLALLIALTGVSTVGTMQFRVQQRAAAEVAMKIFYAEDLFIFSDRYIDSRIPEEVLPALKRWHESPKTAGADFERALEILRESPDPKADNILVTIFRHAGVLPLTNRGEYILLIALIERESDELWRSMDVLIAQSRTDPSSARMLVKLVMAGVESGNDKAIAQLFRVLKSPNQQVQQLSAAALYAHLSRGEGVIFFEQLTAVQAKHAHDPILQMWTTSFAFRRLAQPEATESDLAKAKGFLDQALVNARAIDGVRLEIFKQTPAGQEVEAPPSMVATLASLADAMQGDGGAPAPLTGAVRYFVAQATTALIKEGEKAIPGLHERLIEDGVVLPDTKNTYGDYDDHHGYRGHYGGSSATQNYREVYKLSHLKALQAALDDMAGPLAADTVKINLAMREYLDRATGQLEALNTAGAKAGMMAGGSVPEAAADELYSLLRQGDQVFSGHYFLRALREKGLAPASGDLTGQLAYPEALDASQLTALRGLLAEISRSGNGWDSDGKPRTLTWSEKLYLAGALDSIAGTQMKNFPDVGAPIAMQDDSLALARLSLAISAHPKDAAFALQAEKILIERLSRMPLDAAEASHILTQILENVKGTKHEAEAVKALSAALKLPNGAALAPAARALASAGLVKIAEEAEKAFSAQHLKDELLSLAVRESAIGWRSDLKLRYFRALDRAIADAAAKALAGGKKLDAGQLEALEAAKSLPGLEALAAAAGAPAGDSAAEVAADRANVTLFRGYRLFSGNDFNDGLRSDSLMPGTGNTMLDYRQVYTRDQIEDLRTWLSELAASGKGLFSSAARALTWDEKVYLVHALDVMDAILRENYGAAPAAAPRTLLESVRLPGQEALAVTRLALALEARPNDLAFALLAEETLFKIAALDPNAGSDAGEVLDRVMKAVAGSDVEAKALAALEIELKGPRGAALKMAAIKEADEAVREIAQKAEEVFDDFDGEILKTGLRANSSTWRESFNLRRYRALRAAIEKQASALKTPAAEEKAFIELARTVLPLLEKLGAAAGVPAGDSPAEAAADILNPALQNGYAEFPGGEFNEKLREKGFMDAGSGNVFEDHKQSYTRDEVAALRDWLKGVLAAGKSLDGKRALDEDEKKALTDAIAAAEQALAGFSGKGLPAFAPLALAALPVLSPSLLFALLGLGALYLLWRLWPVIRGGSVESASDERDSIPAAVIARHRRIELFARRMATAVNGGSFRSRFIGSGGTDFAEARPYQGEDLREVDWKTSAKKDELYAKKFELERDMPLMLVVDISGSSRFGTTGTDKRTAIEDAAAVLAMAAAHSNVRVGLVLVSDRVEQVIPARGGSRHAKTIIDAIMNAKAAGVATDLKPGLAAAGKLLGSRAMVAVLSDFIAPDFKDALGALSSRHDVRAIRVTDPAEMGPLPDVGLLPVVDAETGETRMLDTSSKAGRAESGAAVARRELAVENAFTAARLNPISLSTEGDPLESLERAFNTKKK